MELHRNTGRMVRIALYMIGFGLLALFMPALLALMDREFLFGPWFWYLAGGLITLASLYALYNAVRPFRLVFDEAGVSLRVDGLNADIPWTAIAAITVEKLDDQPNSEPHLIIWPYPGATFGPKPSHTRKVDGAQGYSLIEVKNLRESIEVITAGLQRYAAGKYSVAV